jgi:hypothetical protein
MRELDIVEHRLKTQIQTATEGLKLVGDMRKMLGQIDSAPKTNGGKKHGTNGTPANHPGMSTSAKRKQREASKQYWAKVKAGEIKRKGYTPNV